MHECTILYWAAACLALWAGGASDGQTAEAIDRVCDMSGLTIPQEAQFKKMFRELTRIAA